MSDSWLKEEVSQAHAGKAAPRRGPRAWAGPSSESVKTSKEGLIVGDEVREDGKGHILWSWDGV